MARCNISVVKNARQNAPGTGLWCKNDEFSHSGFELEKEAFDNVSAKFIQRRAGVLEEDIGRAFILHMVSEALRVAG